MTPRRKTIIAMLVFLLLGAIVNVAVAWADRIEEHKATQSVRTTRVNPVPACCDRPDLPLRIGPLRSVPIRIDMRLSTRAGWPCSSFEAFMFQYHGDGNRKLVPVSGVWRAGIQISPHILGLTGQRISLPVQPIWSGFAINTVFYTAILWLLFAAPFALRRRIRGGRIKRGLCPACAYPVGDSPVCTECGRAVTPKEATT
jgi:hypothetical protein